MAKIAILVGAQPHVADRLGALRAEIAALKRLEADLMAEVHTLGAGRHEGVAFAVTVAKVPGRESLDPKAAEAKLRELRELGVDGRWFSKHMKATAASTRVTVSAVKGE